MAISLVSFLAPLSPFHSPLHTSLPCSIHTSLFPVLLPCFSLHLPRLLEAEGGVLSEQLRPIQTPCTWTLCPSYIILRSVSSHCHNKPLGFFGGLHPSSMVRAKCATAAQGPPALALSSLKCQPPDHPLWPLGPLFNSNRGILTAGYTARDCFRCSIA